MAVPISKPLRRGGFVGGSDGKRSWVTYKYERLSLFCHFCGFLGHDLKHCVEYFALSKNGGEVVCPYREWLRSSGGRPHSPPRMGSARNQSPSSEGTAEAQNHMGNSLVKPAAEMAHKEENPIGGDVHAKGKDMIPGASPDSSDHVFITDIITKERLRPHLLADNSEALTSKVESKSLNSSQQHMGVRQLELTKGQVEGNEQNGLPVTKQKPTWTRLSRMECGPGKRNTEATPHTLGKRGIQEVDIEVETDTGSKVGKHGRHSEGFLMDETAGVQKHPCQAQ